MVIGISGISRSGKSTLANKIRKFYGSRDTKILCIDKYIVETSKLPIVNGEIDWENPDSINFKKYEDKILQSKSNYKVVIAEGFLTFHEQTLLRLYDKKIFLDISRKIFYQRRFEGYGDEVWYINHVWDSYSRKKPDYLRHSEFTVTNNIFEFDDLIKYLNK